MEKSSALDCSGDTWCFVGTSKPISGSVVFVLVFNHASIPLAWLHALSCVSMICMCACSKGRRGKVSPLVLHQLSPSELPLLLGEEKCCGLSHACVARAGGMEPGPIPVGSMHSEVLVIQRNNPGNRCFAGGCAGCSVMGCPAGRVCRAVMWGWAPKGAHCL